MLLLAPCLQLRWKVTPHFPRLRSMPWLGCSSILIPCGSAGTAEHTKHTGELQVRGPGVFKMYLNKPEATAEAFDSEGWFR